MTEDVDLWMDVTEQVNAYYGEIYTSGRGVEHSQPTNTDRTGFDHGRGMCEHCLAFIYSAKERKNAPTITILCGCKTPYQWSSDEEHGVRPILHKEEKQHIAYLCKTFRTQRTRESNAYRKSVRDFAGRYGFNETPKQKDL